MLSLIFTACLATDASRCKTDKIDIFDENVTVRQCLMMAPMELARWAGDHPNFVIRKWTCGRPGESQNL